MKALALEHSIKCGESFVLSLDRFFCSALQEELLDQYVRPTVFNDIVTKKEAHKNNLVAFRNNYETVSKSEKQISQGEDQYVSNAIFPWK